MIADSHRLQRYLEGDSELLYMPYPKAAISEGSMTVSAATIIQIERGKISQRFRFSHTLYRPMACYETWYLPSDFTAALS